MAVNFTCIFTKCILMITVPYAGLW